MDNTQPFGDKLKKSLSGEFGEIKLRDYTINKFDYVNPLDEDGNRLEVLQYRRVIVIFDLPIKV